MWMVVNQTGVSGAIGSWFRASYQPRFKYQWVDGAGMLQDKLGFNNCYHDLQANVAVLSDQGFISWDKDGSVISHDQMFDALYE